MLKFRYFLFAIILSSSAFAQDYSYKFRVYLNDKGNGGFSINNPEEFLSEKAIERRTRQGIAIDETDLPISQEYITRIESLGCKVVAKSKWLSTLSVHCDDSTLVENIKALDFVQDATFAWKDTRLSVRSGNMLSSKSVAAADANHYGTAYNQIAIHRGDSLHNAGYRGEGMEIAVLDAGFPMLDENLLLSDALVTEVKDFVYSGDKTSDSNHGIKVLSCMATNHPGTFVGTAPKARYRLLRTENPSSEYPIEEDYWVAAAEYADSVGVDLINSSLGYSGFDSPATAYVYSQMDGKTAFITQGAGMAASKGIFVVISAGNEGNKTWKYITAPADSEDVLTIGAVNSSLQIASFSSRGPTADGRTKPDVVAVGQNTAVINQNGTITTDNGTSFSGPVMCGLVACLWQAFPQLTNKQLYDIILQSSSQYSTPDNTYGYGVPNMVTAMDIARNTTGIFDNKQDDQFFIITSDTTGYIKIEKKSNDKFKYNVRIYSIDGKLIVADTFTESEKAYKVPTDKSKVFIIGLKSKDFAVSKKVCF